MNVPLTVNMPLEKVKEIREFALQRRISISEAARIILLKTSFKPASEQITTIEQVRKLIR